MHTHTEVTRFSQAGPGIFYTDVSEVEFSEALVNAARRGPPPTRARLCRFVSSDGVVLESHGDRHEAFRETVASQQREGQRMTLQLCRQRVPFHVFSCSRDDLREAVWVERTTFRGAHGASQVFEELWPAAAGGGGRRFRAFTSVRSFERRPASTRGRGRGPA